MSTPRLNANFVMVPCRCGRVLRAKWDQVGSEIRCWDCHQTSKVVIPQARRRVLNQIFQSMFYLVIGPHTGDVGLAAGLLAIALAVPYGDIIESEDHLGQNHATDWTRIYRRMTLVRLMACLLFAAGTLLPLWVINAGPHRSPRLNLVSLPILGLTWTLLPIVMAGAYANSGSSDRRFLERLGFLSVHPILALAALAIVPAFLLGCEAVLGGLFHQLGLLPFFALNHMPMPGKPLLGNGNVYYNFVSFAELPPTPFIRGYLSGLRHGYSFVGSIPPSISVPTSADLSPRAIEMTWEYYLFLRFLLVFAICLVMTLGFAVQARCLRVLIHAKRHGGA